MKSCFVKLTVGPARFIGLIGSWFFRLNGLGTFFYFALAAGVYIYNKKAGRIYLISAGLIGFARVFSGVHWPADILDGAALGIGTAFLVRHLYRKYKTGR